MANNYITNYNGSLGALSQNLDVNGKKIQGEEVQIITNATNGDIIITPNGTGNIILNGLTFPNTDGSPNNVLVTDGLGNLRFAPQAVGGGQGGGYYWRIAADDSTEINVLTDNTIKFIGGDGLSSASDEQGNITFNQASQDFSITGEATASAISYNGTGAVALNVTLSDTALDDQYLRLDGTTQPSAALNLNSQNITNGGTITATSFVGDLTGNVQGNVTGNVTGTAGSVAFSNVTSTPTTLVGYGITDALALTALSVGADAAASGSGGIAYDNSTGVFTYTPPDFTPYLTAESDTLDNVTGRGNVTTNEITVGTITTTGTNAITTSSMTIYGNAISTTNSNDNLELSASGTGTINIANDVTLPISKSVTFNTNNKVSSPSNNNLRINTSIFTIYNQADDTEQFQVNDGGSTSIYHAGNLKLNTSATGVVITGNTETTDLTATGNISSNNLTSGRITYAGASGLLQDSSKLTFDGATLGLDGTFDATVVQTEGVQITQNNITGTRSNENLVIAANGTGKVQLDDAVLINATLETTVGSDGAASGLPATPERYLKISVNGAEYKIPLYNIT